MAKREVRVDNVITRDPFPGAAKCYVEGSDPSIRVPMRSISQAPTRVATAESGERLEPNPDVVLYDTSGPYTDPAVDIDLRRGLAPLRHDWIMRRGDVEELKELTSAYGREREQDPRLAPVRFERRRPVLRAQSGRRVTQLHYARQGVVTPEMEFIAIREGQRAEACEELSAQHPGQSWGAALPSSITPEFVRDEVARGRAIIPPT